MGNILKIFVAIIILSVVLFFIFWLIDKSKKLEPGHLIDINDPNYGKGKDTAIQKNLCIMATTGLQNENDQNWLQISKMYTNWNKSSKELAQKLITQNCHGIIPPKYCIFKSSAGSPTLPNSNFGEIKNNNQDKSSACESAKKYLQNPVGTFEYSPLYQKFWNADDISIASLIASKNCNDCV